MAANMHIGPKLDKVRIWLLLLMGAVTFASGAFAVSSSETSYSSDTYNTVFAWLSLHEWGWLFVIVGMLELTVRRHWRYAFVVFVLAGALWTAWAMGLWIEVVFGDAETVGGPVQATGYALMSYMAAWALRWRTYES